MSEESHSQWLLERYLKCGKKAFHARYYHSDQYDRDRTKYHRMASVNTREFVAKCGKTWNLIIDDFRTGWSHRSVVPQQERCMKCESA